uniref:ATP synthase complex subunit 8 n=1 Tax=Platystomos albinus TaxID=197009 RepID=J9PHW3_PLAAL|nr:ATP synthase F0 subunit 8 [Platystomos albinus]ARH54575.1 ATP synthase F0 subunit 8 [Platystomos albinus]
MPQMAPLNWTILFTFFIIIFILFNILNYFLYTPSSKSNIESMKLSHKKSWKW